MHGKLGKHYWWPGMRGDIVKWCRACLVCATRHVRHLVKPPLTPIPVAGPFDRVGVDVIQYVKSNVGNRYTVVFIDFLTKKPEVYPVADQTTLTIAKLVEFIPRHGIPKKIAVRQGDSLFVKADGRCL